MIFPEVLKPFTTAAAVARIVIAIAIFIVSCDKASTKDCLSHTYNYLIKRFQLVISVEVGFRSCVRELYLGFLALDECVVG